MLAGLTGGLKVPDNHGRTTEAELAEVVVAILLQTPGGQASYAELVEEIPNHINLTAADLAQSTTRPNESVWEQRLRNITSHKGVEGNYIYEGRLKEIPGGLSLP